MSKPLNFDVAVKQLDGTEISDLGKPLTIGRILSSQFASATKGDALKLFSWAQKLYAGEPVDLDPSDKEVFKEFVKNSETLTILVKAQALAILG
jgi:hypothetical protein